MSLSEYKLNAPVEHRGWRDLVGTIVAVPPKIGVLSYVDVLWNGHEKPKQEWIPAIRVIPENTIDECWSVDDFNFDEDDYAIEWGDDDE